MNTWRSDTGLDVAMAAPRRHSARRMIGQYLTDLTVFLSIVLVISWTFQISSAGLYLHSKLTTQNDIYMAMSQFTPLNMLVSYASTMADMRRDLDSGIGSAGGLATASGQIFATIGWVMLDVCLVAPRTIIAIYRQTSGTGAWVVLAGFAMSIGAVLAWLLSGRVVVWRVLLASMASPLVVSAVFLALQSLCEMVLITYFLLATLAPYIIAVPVICALYWLAFPSAERGITGSLVHAAERLWHGKQA
jgi:hypothetical protein